MDEKLKKVILNNNGLYECIFNAQNIKFQKNNFIWYSLEKAPALYSNIVTNSKDWEPDEIFDDINSRGKKENWKEWSVKDSFSNLDLTEFGFKKLFSAKWVYLEKNNFSPLEKKTGLRYVVVKNESVILDWIEVWGKNENLGKENFSRNLLNNPQIDFIVGYDGDTIVSGCLVNKTEDSLGISNFFAPENGVEYWSEIVSYIFSTIGSFDIAGYESIDVLEKLKILGFEEVGQLAVWLKRKS